MTKNRGSGKIHGHLSESVSKLPPFTCANARKVFPYVPKETAFLPRTSIFCQITNITLLIRCSVYRLFGRYALFMHNHVTHHFSAPCEQTLHFYLLAAGSRRGPALAWARCSSNWCWRAEGYWAEWVFVPREFHNGVMNV